MSAAKKKQVSRSIRQALSQLESPARREILWQQLQTLLSNDAAGIKWLLDELGLFLDKEGKRLQQPFRKTA